MCLPVAAARFCCLLICVAGGLAVNPPPPTPQCTDLECADVRHLGSERGGMPDGPDAPARLGAKTSPPQAGPSGGRVAKRVASTSGVSCIVQRRQRSFTDYTVTESKI